MTELEQREIFTRNFRYYTDRCGKEQKVIAKELGYNYTTFNTWYRGTSMPNAAKIQTLADYFGIKKSDLLDDHSVKDKELSDDERYVIKFRNALNSMDESKKQLMKDNIDNMYKMLGIDPTNL